MQWWLTVFFLLGNSWVSGDHLEGWASRAYATEAECETRRAFAVRETELHPLDAPAMWICSRQQPATRPPGPFLDAGNRPQHLPETTHWYEPANPLGLEIFTAEDLPWVAADGVGLRYTGPLRHSLPDELRKILLSDPTRFRHVLLELDSDGGDFESVREILAVLQEVKRSMDLTTRVMEGSLCASGCIPVFMQGQHRKANPTSIWVFHGARSGLTNVPDPEATREYLDLLSAAGMRPAFREMLERDNRIYRPGSFLISGYELFAVHDSGIITELYPTWREEAPVFSWGLGSR